MDDQTTEEYQTEIFKLCQLIMKLFVKEKATLNTGFSALINCLVVVSLKENILHELIIGNLKMAYKKREEEMFH
jgi:hypothetical protein